MRDKKGFTLIELLAVVIILGVLALIAVPAVTSYIEDTKLTSYVATAKSITGSVGEVANSEKLNMTDKLTTYYIPVEYIKTENDLTSPYGNFTEAYVGVITDNENYNYYWISRDTKGIGVRNITPIKKLNNDNIENSIPVNEITETIRTTGIGSRNIIKIWNMNNNDWDIIELSSTENNISEDGSPADHIGYPVGKTRETVGVGDVLTIGTEEFYLIKRDGDDLVLFAKYNLKVGSFFLNGEKTGEFTSNDEGYGLQSPEAIGFIDTTSTAKGTVPFSSTNYWNNKVGDGKQYPGRYCTSAPFDEGCAYVYDNNSSISTHINNYVNYLKSFGADIKRGRLISLPEAIAFESTSASQTFKTSYATGTAYDSNKRWSFLGRYYGGVFSLSSYLNTNSTGIRPVIIV